MFGAHRSSTASLSEELRKQFGVPDRGGGDYLDYPPPPPQRAPSSAAAAGGGQVLGGADLVAAMAATLKRSSREKLDNVQQGEYGDNAQFFT